MNWKQNSWGLKQGLLGARQQQTLAPSLSAVGTNTYLQPTDFMKMLVVALLLHALILGIAGLWPEEKVTDIPVRALTFKIGAGQRIAPTLAVGASPVQPQPLTMVPSTPAQWRAEAPKKKPRPQPVKPAKIIPLAPTSQRQAPRENPQVFPTIPKPVQAAPKTTQALPDTSILTSHAAVAPSPQRFVREAPVYGNPAASVAGGAETAQAARERYEQEISGWIQRHKLYPAGAGGKEGRAVIRMRIDRTGYVRYYAIEQSAGSAVLDAAAVDMIRRANPMPVVPDSYPAGNLIEFLIPIVFRVPA